MSSLHPAVMEKKPGLPTGRKQGTREARQVMQDLASFSPATGFEPELMLGAPKSCLMGTELCNLWDSPHSAIDPRKTPNKTEWRLPQLFRIGSHQDPYHSVILEMSSKERLGRTVGRLLSCLF